MTALVGSIIFLLVLVGVSFLADGIAADGQNDLGEFLYGAPDYSFTVDHTVEKDLQLNVDMTVAMPCHCKLSMETELIRVLSIDLRDAVGDRLHLSDQFVKDGVCQSFARSAQGYC